MFKSLFTNSLKRRLRNCIRTFKLPRFVAHPRRLLNIITAGVTATLLSAYTVSASSDITLLNWSATHSVTTNRLLHPSSVQDLEQLVAEAHKSGHKIRPLGSGISPNGIAFCPEGMVALSSLNKILWIDKATKTVRVQAGARIYDVVEALRPHNLTLQNYASISEQQVGGFVQAGAHGTGARIPPVEEQVVSMKLVTPAKGTIEVSRNKNSEVFRLAQVGLGALGIVAEVTLQCVELHKLVEKTVLLSRADVVKDHNERLKNNQHVRYMWIPYTDSVIVVTCNPLKNENDLNITKKFTDQERLEATRNLLIQTAKVSKDSISNLSFTQLRDELLALNPLDLNHIIRVNKAEEDYWRKNEGIRVDTSDRILGFDCGGQQWVCEVALPNGTQDNPSGKDLLFMSDLMDLVESNGIPAPAPIEQRWTAASGAKLSPAYSPDKNGLFSWVGIIMYLPLHDKDSRNRITARFANYQQLCESKLWEKYECLEHWGKWEFPSEISASEKQRMITSLEKRGIPVKSYTKLRKEFDPNNILANNTIQTLFS